MYALESFTCNDPNELYQHLVKFPWEKLLPQNGYFSVTSNVFHPTINTNLFANLKVKDAIVDRMRTITHQRPLTGASLQGAVFYLFWKNNEAEIFIDTSGETLAKHGYRKLPGTAPMLEALAAATILSTRWDKKSAFVNPMCGSGTLAIEAALIATNRVPGLWRDHYAFMHILGYKKEMYELEKLKLKEQIIKLPSLQIIATDISKRAIEVAKANANSWEGLMLRADEPYKGKRSKDLLKYKSFSDDEYEVVDVEMGPFRYVKNGAECEETMLSCVTIMHKDHAVRVGSGFSIEQRQDFYKHPKKILGKIITVQYFAESRNQDGGISLRFPTFKILHGVARTV